MIYKSIITSTCNNAFNFNPIKNASRVSLKLSSTILLVLAATTRSAVGLLLSDLPTPSLVLDVHSIQRKIGTDVLPPLALRRHNAVLIPVNPANDVEIDETVVPVELLASTTSPFSYLHCTVKRPREDADPILDDPASTFLAELDFEPTILQPVKLVLGLNNHHVGSYYWARSAGAGAAMDAPGIVVDERGIVRWQSKEGPIDCNSNDGKRSEWVNFLRTGDTVQLLPEDAEAAIHQFARQGRVYGISSQGRPLGSEPEVVCTWKLN